MLLGKSQLFQVFMWDDEAATEAEYSSRKSIQRIWAVHRRWQPLLYILYASVCGINRD